GRAYDFLRERFSGVNRIWGLTMVYEDNEVQKRLTALDNLGGALSGLPENILAYFDLMKRFAPDVVISDFETWTYLFAKARRLPIIDIDNMQIINRCEHDDALLAGFRREFQLSKAIVKSKLPF